MTDFFKKIVTNPLEKMVKNNISGFINKAENALIDAVGDSLGRLGLSSNSRNKYLAALGDSILSGIASEFFGAFNGELDRITKKDIIKNTGFASTDAIGDNLSQPSTITNLHYPEDLNKYYVSFAFKAYERPTPFHPVKKIEKDSISLPLPRDLVESHEVDYNSGATGMAGSVFNGVPSASEGISGNTLGQAGVAAAAYGVETAASLLGNDFLMSLQQAAGAVANPNIATVFKSPKMRSHKFSWTFAPNNENESRTIRDIIKRFKQSALPKVFSDTTAALGFPDLCQVTLYPWGNGNWNPNTGYDDSYMYVFKTCVIESVSVNYAPELPAFFASKGSGPAPGFITLSISLLEVEYFTANDYGVAKQGAGTVVMDNLKTTLNTLTGATQQPTETGE